MRVALFSRESLEYHFSLINRTGAERRKQQVFGNNIVDAFHYVIGETLFDSFASDEKQEFACAIDTAMMRSYRSRIYAKGRTL